MNEACEETKLTGIKIQKGDTLDFIVDCRADGETDSFRWASSVKVAGSKESAPKEGAWSAKEDFRGPAPRPLAIWERYAHVLLQTNEFAFVD